MASPHVAGVAAQILESGVAAADVPDELVKKGVTDKITGLSGGQDMPNVLLQTIL